MALFRVLRGKHSEGKDEYNRPIIYTAGQIVDSSTDLLRQNTPNAPPKFELLNPDGSSERGRSSNVALAQSHSVPQPAPAKAAATAQAASKPQSNIAVSPSQIPAIQNPLGNDTLDTMTLKELQAFASEEEIDLKGEKEKDKILKIIRGHKPK